MSITINKSQTCQKRQNYGINIDGAKPILERGIALIVSDPILLTTAHIIQIMDNVGCFFYQITRRLLLTQD